MQPVHSTKHISFQQFKLAALAIGIAGSLAIGAATFTFIREAGPAASPSNPPASASQAYAGRHYLDMQGILALRQANQAREQQAIAESQAGADTGHHYLDMHSILALQVQRSEPTLDPRMFMPYFHPTNPNSTAQDTSH